MAVISCELFGRSLGRGGREVVVAPSTDVAGPATEVVVLIWGDELEAVDLGPDELHAAAVIVSMHIANNFFIRAH